MSKLEILNELICYYCSELAEDKIDGTPFDCKVIDTIEKIIIKEKEIK